MNLKLAKFIEIEARNADIEVDIYEDYSGRGMFGEKTTALVGTHNAITAALVVAATMVDSEGFLAEEIALFAKNMRLDNLGKDMVAY